MLIKCNRTDYVCKVNFLKFHFKSQIKEITVKATETQ